MLDSGIGDVLLLLLLALGLDYQYSPTSHGWYHVGNAARPYINNDH